MYRAKKKSFEKKDGIGLHDDGSVEIDLIPLMSTTFKSCFAQIDKNQYALKKCRKY